MRQRVLDDATARLLDRILDVPARRSSQSDRLQVTLELALVSPAFGGGASPGQCDLRHPFRAPAIRGQLRFWWRAARGCAFRAGEVADLDALEHMRLVEGSLWGITNPTRRRGDEPSALSSCIRLHVEALDADAVRSQVIDERVPMSSGRGYVFFPGRKTRRTPCRSYWWGPRLRLSIDADLGRGARVAGHATGDTETWTPDRVREEIEAAVWAWCAFGGYGARTRRGAGALRVLSVNGNERLEALFPPARDVSELAESIAAAARILVKQPGGDLPDSPVLARARVVVVPVDEKPDPLLSPEELAVEAAGRLVQRFRQDRFGPRGRSRWPEPDSLRILRNAHDPRHAPAPETKPFFPRAQLGLPIMFHFKDARDPSESELTGAEVDRMASPLVVRPWRLGSDLALVVLALNTPWQPPGGLAIRYQEGQTKRAPVVDDASPAGGASRAGTVGPLRERHADNALDAFIRYAGDARGAKLVTIS